MTVADGPFGVTNEIETHTHRIHIYLRTTNQQSPPPVTYGVSAMPVVPMFTREPRRRRLATAPTVGHARLGRAIHAARGRRGTGRTTRSTWSSTWCRSTWVDVDAVEGERPQTGV